MENDNHADQRTGSRFFKVDESSSKDGGSRREFLEFASAGVVAAAAQAGKFELYKTSHHVDGTFANPEWLG